MLRFIITFLMFIFTVGQVYAGGESMPNPGAADNERTLYLHAHTISHVEHGEIKANNHLRVWNKNVKEMDFSVMTISNDYHECFLEGKATQVALQSYEYRENKCRVLFVFDQDEVTLRVTGANGAYCRTDDLRAGNGCGFNTLIDSATYKKAKPVARSNRL